MSFEVDGTTITLTRGDSLILKINLTEINDDGVVVGEYIPDPDDEIRFALKRPLIKNDKSGFIDEEPLIRKPIPNDTLLLQLDPEDTKSLPFGKYKYDIEIKFKDGFVSTFIKKAKFILDEEVD